MSCMRLGFGAFKDTLKAFNDFRNKEQCMK